jgi:release factor glutamine methyltransferase
VAIDRDPERIWTVLAALNWTAQRFAQAGLDSSRLEAEVLLAHATGLGRVGLYVAHDRPLDSAERARYRQLVQRRLGGEPVAYLIGRREFWSLDLEVDPRVLIPRRETEHVVEEVLRELPPAGGEVRLGDVGTGSGAIALAVKRERPDAHVLATDASSAAVELARANAGRLGLEVTFVVGDLVEPLRPFAPLDLIASNPPYIATGKLAGLPVEVRREPTAALDGGPDGLAVLRRLIECAAPLLRSQGRLVLEIGSDQAKAVVAMVEQASAYQGARVVRDLAGLDRVVVARCR